MRNTTIDLPKGAMATYRAGLPPVSITCASGLLWATIDGSSTDFILASGETARFDRRGTIVIQALQPTTVRVERGRQPDELTAYPPGSRTISNTPVAVP